MRKELQDKIYERFPNWFNTETAPYQGGFYGFELGNGWFYLIWELLNKLEPIVVRFSDFKVEQVKEKFGTLRFYYSFTNEDCTEEICDSVKEIYELVEQAEKSLVQLAKYAVKRENYAEEDG